MTRELKLYSYWRSSASYRVRIALNLKGLQYQIIPVNLVANEQFSSLTDEQNPQHMVPVLVHGSRIMRQSLPIMEWLEEQFEGQGVPLLSYPPRERVRIRAMAQLIATDIAPINVLRVLNYLSKEHGFTEQDKKRWNQHWIKEGFDAFEKLLDNPSTGEFCEGDEPTIVDCCLIPQVYNALRWEVEMQQYPRIWRIYQSAMQLPAFQNAAPEAQPDAPKS